MKQQRAIFVFNFAQQTLWPNANSINTYTIGVFGPDPTLSNIKALAKKRPIHGRSVKVKQLNTINDIDDVDIIYVNKKYGFNIKPIIDVISNNSILLITEGYDYHTSMINMVAKNGSYQYEINKDLIKNANLEIARTLEEYAVKSATKWEALYKKTEEQLSAIEQQNETQKEIIEKQEDVISEKNYSIKNLAIETEIKEKALEEKLEIEKHLEYRIKEQLNEIELQQEKIRASNEHIENQRKFLQVQDANIEAKQKALDESSQTISSQKRNNLNLLIILGLLLIGSSWIYISYIRNKKLNFQLNSQHIAIKKQSNLLESKNKELEQFAYIASHDLQEPLNTVSSFIDLIKSEYNDKFDDDGRESLGFIKEASIRMKKLIDALLQYSRLGRNTNLKTVDCNKVLDELKADLKVSIEDSNAKINYNNLPTIKGNEIELRLLFQNLISNSIKFKRLDINPEITITCNKISENDSQYENGHWEFSIADNGIGIPLEYRSRIFGIFQRLHSREDFKGSGIGLAHCKKIVESHGGEIWLDSKEEEEGSTFFVSIPA